MVRGVGLAGLGYVLAQVINLGFYTALARLASPHDFGVFAAGSLLVAIGGLFAESGMMAAVIHRQDRLDEAASTAVIACAAAGCGFALLALAVSPLVGLFFDSAAVGRIAAGTSGLLLIRSLQVVPEALLQRRFSFLRRVVIEPVSVIAFGIAAVIATAKGLGAWGLVIGYYAAAVTDVTLSWTLVGWRPRPRSASIAMWRELISYGRFVVASVAVMRLGDQVPVVLIGRSVGAGALGQFRYAGRMASTPFALIVQAAAYVLFPALSRITSNRERFRSASLRSLRLMCAGGFPLGFLLVPLGVPSAVIVFGDVWEEAGRAAMILAGYCIGGILVSYVSEVVKAAGRPDIQARTQVVSAVSGTVFMIVLLPFGLLGVVAGFSLGTLTGGTYGLWRVGRLLDFPASDILREVWGPTVAGAVMAGLLVAVEMLLVHASNHALVTSLALLGMEALGGLAIYAGALHVLAPGTLHDMTAAMARLRPSGKRAGQGPAEPASAASAAATPDE